MEDPCTTSADIEERIARAQSEGIVLTEMDMQAIRSADAAANESQARAERLSDCDPMNKGTAFPMGVGFTRMTKRKSQAIDTSVRRAGEAVTHFKKAEVHRKSVADMLAGKGTDADKVKRREQKKAHDEGMMRKILSGEPMAIGNYRVTRITRDREGYPSSLVIAGEGIIKGIDDRIALKSLFGGTDAVRSLADQVRGAHPHQGGSAAAD